MARPKAGGGWQAIRYTFKQSRAAGNFIVGPWRFYRALRTRNACKTCALGMGGQKGGMVNERGQFPEVCKKSMQAMAADMQGAIKDHFFDDFSIEKLATFTPRELEHAGRLTKPLYAGPLDSYYKVLEWDDALARLGKKLKATEPDDSFFYFSGRSSNEAGFLLQLFARLYGTNNVNNCSFYCHQASGVGLTSVTGSGTATITLEDLDKTDLVLLIGANPSSNHPRFMRTLMDLKRRGGKVVVINPLREVGLEKFKVPSDIRSLFFGTAISDMYVQPHIGGDMALLAGVARAVIDRRAIDDTFIQNNTQGWDAFRDWVCELTWEEIEKGCGVSRHEIEQIARHYAASNHTVFVWAMGVTHHIHGVENVQMIANLALIRGMVGKEGSGLLPLRGHSNVQGIGSMGVTPVLKQAIFDRLENHFNVELPTKPGRDTLDCIHAAAEGDVRLAMCLGGNLYGSNPDSEFAQAAMKKIDMVTYLSTTLNTGHVRGMGKETIIFPVLARDEEAQSTTQESMFNFVRLSDGGRARHVGPRSEVDVIASIAESYFDTKPATDDIKADDAAKDDTQAQVSAASPVDWASMRQHGEIRQAIGAIIPGYEAVDEIDRTKKEFQIDGRTFHDPKFATDHGGANFHTLTLPDITVRSGILRLMTVRSEGQFNTVVYEEEDIYRGQTRRDVVLMNAQDIRARGLYEGQSVTVKTSTGEWGPVIARAIDIPQGNAAAYFPEANVLIPRSADRQSQTPAFKCVHVTVVASPTKAPVQ